MRRSLRNGAECVPPLQKAPFGFAQGRQGWGTRRAYESRRWRGRPAAKRKEVWRGEPAATGVE
jgi:hypothetical protein